MTQRIQLAILKTNLNSKKIEHATVGGNVSRNHRTNNNKKRHIIYLASITAPSPAIGKQHETENRRHVAHPPPQSRLGNGIAFPETYRPHVP